MLGRFCSCLVGLLAILKSINPGVGGCKLSSKNDVMDSLFDEFYDVSVLMLECIVNCH